MGRVRKFKVKVRPTTYRRKGKLIRRKGYVYERMDVGAPGKGTKVIRIKREGALIKLGYSTDKPADERRKALSKAVKRYGARRVWYMLHAQYVFRKKQAENERKRFGRVVTEGIVQDARIFESDRNWIKRTFKPKLGRKRR